jgi:GTP pyrophosphokinase
MDHTKQATREVRTIDDLISKVRSYDSGADTEYLSRAFYYSSEAHGLQKRKEGTPYMDHPLAVASILADMKMDVVTISAGLLHDTVEDTHISPDDVRKRFGYELAFLVDSLTKLSLIEFKSKEHAQAENFRKMLLSMSEDIRVIIIKFADRLHNMRTLGYLPQDKRRRIATETLEIYAPLANRLGIGWMRTEFEDLSFKYLWPHFYNEINKKVKKKRTEQEGYIKDLIDTVREKIDKEGLPARVLGRVKHLYGIYTKMQRQGIPFELIHDVLGIRIITDNKPNCYAILGLIHSLWKPIPGKFKDYIGVPKSNMYRSLHTTVIGPGGERVEFQIRTEQMQMIAEEGIAAHWRYKDTAKDKKGKDDRYVSWLRELVQMQNEEPDAMGFMEAVKAEVVPDVIYVFTPEGDIKELPEGSTPIDFAYSIHTEIGHRCIGARVNARIVPLRHRLTNGNTVEILTSKTHRPSRDWLNSVVTQRAKSRIKQWLKTEERKQSVELGEKLIDEELRKRRLETALLKSKLMEQVVSDYNMKTLEDIFASVGYGKISPQQVVNRLRPDQQQEETPTISEKPLKEQKGIIIKGIDDILYHTAKCCFPVPGDNLTGFITRGKGVAVHRSDCQNLHRVAVDEARLIEVQWKANKDITSYARLAVDTEDKPGILADLSAILSAAEVNISHLEATTSPYKNARITFIIEVKSKRQLNSIIRKISQTSGVTAVKRY